MLSAIISNVDSKYDTNEAQCDRELKEQRTQMRKQAKVEAKQMIKEIKR